MAGLLQLCAYLGFIEGLPFNFLIESLGDGGALEDTVLAEEKPVLQGELCEREADNEALPWKERPVEPAAQALHHVSHGSLSLLVCALT